MRYSYHGIQELRNLNDAVIPNADGPDVPLRSERGHVASKAVSVEVAFTNLDVRLCDMIQRYPVVVGCMAWLTNEMVLAALATREVVSIVVNKEDFLRPDRGGWSQQNVKTLYGKVPGFCRYEIGRSYSFSSIPEADAIRCAGVYADRGTVPPRMHHKFFVFCEFQYFEYDLSSEEWVPTNRTFPDEGASLGQSDVIDDIRRQAIPRAVWTGSFNATFNGTQSLENAVIITDDAIAQTYFDEWCDIIGISEPLDWESPYVAPEWRFGS